MGMPQRWNVDWGVKMLDPKFAAYAAPIDAKTFQDQFEGSFDSSSSADAMAYAVANPARQMGKTFDQLSRAAAKAGSAFGEFGKSISGMRVTVDKSLGTDQFVLKHDNEAIVSPEMFEKLQQQVQKRMDDQITGMLRNPPKTPDPAAVKEQEQMENLELWGSF